MRNETTLNLTRNWRDIFAPFYSPHPCTFFSLSQASFSRKKSTGPSIELEWMWMAVGEASRLLCIFLLRFNIHFEFSSRLFVPPRNPVSCVWGGKKAAAEDKEAERSVSKSISSIKRLTSVFLRSALMSFSIKLEGAEPSLLWGAGCAENDKKLWVYRIADSEVKLSVPILKPHKFTKHGDNTATADMMNGRPRLSIELQSRKNNMLYGEILHLISSPSLGEHHGTVHKSQAV